jgi:hypothetical protein
MLVNRNTWVMVLVIAVFSALTSPGLIAAEVGLAASKDNSVFSEGELSNAVGDYLFAGETAIGDFRRALIAFDIAGSLPAGAIIDSVQLNLNISKVPDADPQSFSLHRLTSDWGEGSSNAPGEEGRGAEATTDDATWFRTFFPLSFWTSEGGDFVPTASVTTSFSGLGVASFSSADAFVADVQLWLDQPETNFGWILVGDESSYLTAKRFDSRENSVENFQPRLIVTFTPTGACCSISGDCTDVQASVCQTSGGIFKAEGSSCELIQECPVFQDSFEN